MLRGKANENCTLGMSLPPLLMITDEHHEHGGENCAEK
jgi:hypothetical protein